MWSLGNWRDGGMSNSKMQDNLADYRYALRKKNILPPISCFGRRVDGRTGHQGLGEET